MIYDFLKKKKKKNKMKKSFLLTLNCHTIYMYIIEIHQFQVSYHSTKTT